MSAHIQQARLLSGRHMTLMAVIGLHALVITALMVIRTVPALIDQGQPPIVAEVIPPDPLPPEQQQPLDNFQQTVTVPKAQSVVDVLVPIEMDAGEAITVPQGSVVPVDSGPSIGLVGPIGPAVTAPTRVTTDLKYQITRSSDEYYPDTSVMLQEEGIATVRVCFDAAGRIQGVPTIETGSGHKRLDKAAVRWASESLRFTPATVDGVGVAGCKGFRVKFNLR